MQTPRNTLEYTKNIKRYAIIGEVSIAIKTITALLFDKIPSEIISTLSKPQKAVIIKSAEITDKVIFIFIQALILFQFFPAQ
ncbi:hypothetical protein LCGC14_1386570 [marine sediment metagenome]|uniref:CNNM transmembrane domain-containing protein n=1 Tax=marine sediment metagenome TaxID=412755 RepID=A0A0F9K1H1_9ZZZZ